MNHVVRLIGVAAALALGCGQSETSKSPSPGASKPASEGGGGAAKAPDPAKPAAPAPAKLHEGLASAVKAVAANCKFSAQMDRIESCPAGEKDAPKELLEGMRNDPAGLETLSGLLLDADPKVVAAAGEVVREATGTYMAWGFGKDNPNRATFASADSAARLLNALEKAPVPVGHDIVKVAVWAGTINGQHARVFAVLDGVSDVYVRRNGYEAAATHGRVAVLEHLKKFAATGDPKDTEAAIEAVSNMYDLDAAERAPACDWVKGFLGHENHEVGAKAGQVMIYPCGGAYIDALLDEGDRRLGAKALARPWYFTFRNVCFSMARGLAEHQSTPQQCGRVYAFLQKVTDDESVTPEVRGLFFDAISYQRRDKASLDLCRKYQSSKVPEIKKSADGCVKMLTESYNLK